ncbi:LAETG motif-containing sortase-dependent surface protein [Streptomyces sp. NPDC046831]|uniref:LAETG motif-containing sortase-dependent surface protein n=1 Tax=Streptomyces sp. NPDC046831 TaxID=3154805 RepID=UPI0033C1B6FE
MKLRRAMVTAAATAVIAPLALLSAPSAFAEDTPSTPPSSSSSESAPESAPESTPESTPPTSEPESTPPTSEPESTPSTSAPGASPSTSAPQASPSTSAPSSTPSEPGDWTPDECNDFNLDEKLQVTIKGLPSKIVAGSGWHGFTFSVKNKSSKDLKNVWVSTITEYADDVNLDDSLAYDLAQLQFRDPETGRWTDSYQMGDDSGDASGTFVGVIDAIDKGAKVDMDLRVKVSAKAPAGSSFAMSTAVYAGDKGACNGNGDSYEFTVVKAGSKPGDVGDSKPNGEKPSGKPQGDLKPQGGSEQLPVTGSLAETGSSSALPMIGLVGGAAVVAGAGAVVLVRRRKAGASA